MKAAATPETKSTAELKKIMEKAHDHFLKQTKASAARKLAFAGFKAARNAYVKALDAAGEKVERPKKK